jgi:EF hand
MRTSIFLMMICVLLIASSVVLAQRTGADQRDSSRPDGDDVVARLMQFDKDKDGKLTKAEVTDERLHRLIDRADADHDGFVTREELTTLAAREQSTGRGGFGNGGPGGPPPGGGPGGPMMGRSRPGEVLSSMLQQRLSLTAEQKTQVEALQKEVDSRLEKILTDEQKTLLRELRDRGPGGFGPPGGGRPPGGGPPPYRSR